MGDYGPAGLSDIHDRLTGIEESLDDGLTPQIARIADALEKIADNMAPNAESPDPKVVEYLSVDESEKAMLICHCCGEDVDYDEAVNCNFCDQPHHRRCMIGGPSSSLCTGCAEKLDEPETTSQPSKGKKTAPDWPTCVKGHLTVSRLNWLELVAMHADCLIKSIRQSGLKHQEVDDLDMILAKQPKVREGAWKGKSHIYTIVDCECCKHYAPLELDGVEQDHGTCTFPSIHPNLRNSLGDHRRLTPCRAFEPVEPDAPAFHAVFGSTTPKVIDVDCCNVCPWFGTEEGVPSHDCMNYDDARVGYVKDGSESPPEGCPYKDGKTYLLRLKE